MDDDLLLGSVRSAFTVLTDAAALYDAVSSVSVVADECSALSLHFADNRIRVRCEGANCSSARDLEVVALSGDAGGRILVQPPTALPVSVRPRRHADAGSRAKRGAGHAHRRAWCACSCPDVGPRCFGQGKKNRRKRSKRPRRRDVIGAYGDLPLLRRRDPPGVCPGCLRLRRQASRPGKEYIYQCQNCNARVGCHKGTKRPLGHVANETLRLKRMETHQVFDAFWKSKGVSRTKGYQWLARQMELPERLAHIGGFEMDQCQQGHRPLQERRGGRSIMCEKNKCRHRAEGFCACPPVKNREEKLSYPPRAYGGQYDGHPLGTGLYGLKHPEKRRLCRGGHLPCLRRACSAMS